MIANLKLINRERKKKEKFYLEAKSPLAEALIEAFNSLSVVLSVFLHFK
jgi:hypothetical protein